jgi:hypothetical protein
MTHTNCWFCFYLFYSLWHVSYSVVAPHQFRSPKWLYTLLTALPNPHATVKYSAWCTVLISWNLTHSFGIPLWISLFIGLMFLDCSNSGMVGSNSTLDSMDAFLCAMLSCEAGGLAVDRSRIKEFTEMSKGFHVPGLIMNQNRPESLIYNISHDCWRRGNFCCVLTKLLK